jgi:hypothetical protein
VRCAYSAIIASVPRTQTELFFKMSDDTWAVLEPVNVVNEKDPIGAATKKYSRAQLHKGNLALVHPGFRIGPR